MSAGPCWCLADERAAERAARAFALRDLVPVVMMHHPVINPRGAWRTFSRGLAEAEAMRSILSEREGELVFLHGHLHYCWLSSWQSASASNGAPHRATRALRCFTHTY